MNHGTAKEWETRPHFCGFSPFPFFISVSAEFRMASGKGEEASRSRQRWLLLQGATLGFPYEVLADP